MTRTCDRCRRNVEQVPEVRLEGMRLGGADFLLPDGTRIDLCAECFADHLGWVRRGKVQTDAALFAAQVQMMDVVARCIADGHRGNGSAEDDSCCQVCQEIVCDDDCPVAVAVAYGDRRQQEGEELERGAIVEAIREYYRVAPKAAEPLLRAIGVEP
jgi:hypothetical protein